MEERPVRASRRDESEDEDRADERAWDDRADDLADDQIDAADQQRERADLAGRAAVESEEQLQQSRDLILAALSVERQRCRTCQGVSSLRQSRHRPCGHVCRERDEQEDTGRDRRVGEVLSDAAEELLHDYDREEASDDGLPEREVCRHVERDEQSRQSSGKISDCLFLMCDSVVDVLEEYAGCYAYDRQQQGPEAEDVNAGDPCRRECQKHRAHEPCSIRLRHDVW